MPRISEDLIYFDSSGSVCHGATITISEYMSALKKKKVSHIACILDVAINPSFGGWWGAVYDIFGNSVQ